MGVIKKQGIQGTFLMLAGVFIGFLISAVLFPKILEKEQIGLLHTVLAYSFVLSKIASLGFNSVIARMFSYFRNYNNKHNNFFFFVLLIIIVGSALSLILFFIFKDKVIEYNIKKSPLFVDYFYYVIPLTIGLLIFSLFDKYYTVLYKSVRGVFLKELVLKLAVLIFLGFYYIQIISFRQFTLLYIFAYIFPAIALGFMLIYEGEFIIKPKFDFVSKDLAKTMFSIGLYGIVLSIASEANLQIGKMMSTSMIDLDATGVFSTSFIFATFIKVPSKAILRISSAVIAESWKNNNIKTIKTIYKETAFNQYIIAVLILVGLWANIHNILELLGEGFEAGKYIILIMGFAYVVEMSGGAVSHIIATSSSYKIITWLSLLSIVLIVVFNYIFIPMFGVLGVALAICLTVIIFTALQILFVYKKFHMQAFNIKFLFITIIAVITYLLSLLIPVFDNFILDIFIRSAAISAIYALLLVVTGVSPYVNKFAKDLVN